VWGGIHGSVSMALALSLRQSVPHRAEILTMAFGVVAFSIVGQGLTGCQGTICQVEKAGNGT
jgi:CPA1 family monovalent cation:H+ antiporter